MLLSVGGYCGKTDTNITDTGSIKRFKLSTGSCFVCIRDLNWLLIPKVESVKARAFLTFWLIARLQTLNLGK